MKNIFYLYFQTKIDQNGHMGCCCGLVAIDLSCNHVISYPGTDNKDKS